MDYKAEFLEIFQREVSREGSESFLKWLEGTDFFTAPASTWPTASMPRLPGPPIHSAASTPSSRKPSSMAWEELISTMTFPKPWAFTSSSRSSSSWVSSK